MSTPKWRLVFLNVWARELLEGGGGMIGSTAL